MLENYLVSHEPEIQAFLLTEISTISKQMIEFIETKLTELNKNG